MPKTETTSEASTTSPPSSVCFAWDNYQNHFSQVVRQLFDEECMLDVTLAVGGQRIRAHRLVLCACSDLLAEILSQNNDEQVTVILSDIDPKDVRSIVEFIYTGEVRTPVENINDFLAAAQTLKIQSLMEIGPFNQEEENDENALDACDDSPMFDEFHDNDDDSEKIGFESSNEVKSETKDDAAKRLITEIVGRRRRKSVTKKEYTDEMLSSAINSIKAGNSLLDAAAEFHIPRSTLYMRAKVLGVPLTNHKCEYTSHDMKGAVDAVIAGSSLQNAADTFGIPKTVLWRRIQKEGHVYRMDTRRSYDAEQREAAIKALERGEALTKVSHEYQIPKTTLFRDKVRLVDEGKLPESDWKKRKSYIEGEKRMQLEKAVAECKKGTMSQATASMTFNIPKTTIWRRLQRDAGKNDYEPKRASDKKVQHKEKKIEDAKAEDVNESNFEIYCDDDDSQMSITYIEDTSMTDDPNVIILSSSTATDHNLHNNRFVVVGENYIDLELDENATFEVKS